MCELMVSLTWLPCYYRIYLAAAGVGSPSYKSVVELLVGSCEEAATSWLDQILPPQLRSLSFALKLRAHAVFDTQFLASPSSPEALQLSSAIAQYPHPGLQCAYYFLEVRHPLCPAVYKDLLVVFQVLVHDLVSVAFTLISSESPRLELP